MGRGWYDHCEEVGLGFEVMEEVRELLVVFVGWPVRVFQVLQVVDCWVQQVV